MSKDEKKQSLPKPSFSNLVLSIASTAALKLGLDSENKAEKNLDLARYNIDLLNLIKEKTKNNLSKDEEGLLNSCLADLQLQFVSCQNEK